LRFFSFKPLNAQFDIDVFFDCIVHDHLINEQIVITLYSYSSDVVSWKIRKRQISMEVGYSLHGHHPLGTMMNASFWSLRCMGDDGDFVLQK